MSDSPTGKGHRLRPRSSSRVVVPCYRGPLKSLTAISEFGTSRDGFCNRAEEIPRRRRTEPRHVQVGLVTSLGTSTACRVVFGGTKVDYGGSKSVDRKQRKRASTKDFKKAVVFATLIFSLIGGKDRDGRELEDQRWSTSHVWMVAPRYHPASLRTVVGLSHRTAEGGLEME